MRICRDIYLCPQHIDYAQLRKFALCPCATFYTAGNLSEKFLTVCMQENILLTEYALRLFTLKYSEEIIQLSIEGFVVRQNLKIIEHTINNCNENAMKQLILSRPIREQMLGT